MRRFRLWSGVRRVLVLSVLLAVVLGVVGWWAAVVVVGPKGSVAELPSCGSAFDRSRELERWLTPGGALGARFVSREVFDAVSSCESSRKRNQAISLLSGAASLTCVAFTLRLHVRRLREHPTSG